MKAVDTTPTQGNEEALESFDNHILVQIEVASAMSMQLDERVERYAERVRGIIDSWTDTKEGILNALGYV